MTGRDDEEEEEESQRCPVDVAGCRDGSSGRGGAGGCGCHDTVLVFFPAVVSTATENTVVHL